LFAEIKQNGGKENNLMDDETLISTQELDRVVQSAEVQQSRMPLLCSPPKNNSQITPPWAAATRNSKVLGNTIMPRQLLMPYRRVPASHDTELHHKNSST
jgi:hypothetical protein